MIDPVALDNHAGQQALLKFGFQHDPEIKDSFMLKLARKRFVDLSKLIRDRMDWDRE